MRAERERLGLSQSDFGAAAGGVDRKSQFNYECGKRSPDADYLAAAAALGVDVRYVITGLRDYQPPPALSADEQVMLTHWREASSATRKAALGALVGVSAGASRVLVTGKVGQHIHGDVHQRDISIFGKKGK